MKKNIKFIGAAAAALLAVAPVVSTGVANAAVNTTNTGSTKGTETGGNTDVNIPNVNLGQATSQGVKDKNNVNAVIPVATAEPSTPDLNKWGTSFDASKIQFTYAENGQTAEGYKGLVFSPVVNVFDVTGKNASNPKAAIAGLHPIANGTKLTAGHTYIVRLSATISTPNANQNYTINGDKISQPSSQSSTVSNVPVYATLGIVDPNIKGQPFFANAKSNGFVYADGQTVPATATGNNKVVNNTLKGISDTISNMGLYSFKSSEQANASAEHATIGESEIKSQLTKQGVTVASNGNVTVPSKGFTITLTRTNAENGKKATLNVFFKSEQGEYSEYPIINLANAKTGSTIEALQQGETVINKAPIVTVKLGTKDWASDIIKNFSAQQSTPNNSKLLLTTQNLSSSEINTNQTGLYKATLKATNTANLTTTLDFNVAVVGDAKDTIQTVKVLGDKNEVIKLVSIVNDKTSDLQGNVVNEGQDIEVYPNDTKTVDGVEYTRVYNKANTDRTDTNEWIQTKYIKEEKTSEKTIMHVAIVYDKEGKKTSEKISAYDKVTVYGDIVTINGAKFYKVGDNRYVKVGNIDGTMRTLKHNAYIYNNKLKRVQKNTVLKKGSEKRTYGSAFTIKGKKVYRIGENQYVKVANFK